MLKNFSLSPHTHTGHSPTAGTPPSPVGANKLALGSPPVMSPPPAVEYPAMTTPTPVKSKSRVPDVISSPMSNGLSCDLTGSGGGLQRSMSTTSNDSEVPEFASSIKGESRVTSTGDPSRDKCRELLTKALQKGYKDSEYATQRGREGKGHYLPVTINPGREATGRCGHKKVWHE